MYLLCIHLYLIRFHSVINYTANVYDNHKIIYLEGIEKKISLKYVRSFNKLETLTF